MNMSYTVIQFNTSYLLFVDKYLQTNVFHYLFFDIVTVIHTTKIQNRNYHLLEKCEKIIVF